MRQILLITSLGAVIVALVVYLTAPDYPEIVPAGALIGAMAGLGIAARIAMRNRIHDDNLTTIARRNLSRNARHDTFGVQIFEEKIERLGSRDRAKGKSRNSP